MDYPEFLGAAFAILLRDWPVSKLVMYYLNKTRMDKVTKILVFFISMVVVFQLIRYFVGGFEPSVLLAEIVGVGILSYLNYQRLSEKSKLIRFLHHVATRWIIGVVAFPLIVIVAIPFLKLFNIEVISYEIPLLIALVYSFFIIRKRKPNKIIMDKNETIAP